MELNPPKRICLVLNGAVTCSEHKFGASSLDPFRRRHRIPRRHPCLVYLQGENFVWAPNLRTRSVATFGELSFETHACRAPHLRMLWLSTTATSVCIVICTRPVVALCASKWPKLLIVCFKTKKWLNRLNLWLPKLQIEMT